MANLSVMIVDDVSSTRKIMERMLRGKIFKAILAKDGVECVELMNELKDSSQSVDLILLDNEMPRMSGVEAAKVLRSQGFTTPIIGITGNALPEDKAEFLSAGVNKVMTKPLDIEALVITIKDILIA
jgi:CheY-like chemotaxis protein